MVKQLQEATTASGTRRTKGENLIIGDWTACLVSYTRAQRRLSGEENKIPQRTPALQEDATQREASRGQIP